jgi:malate dehydrogenase (oxaloacetate-decarboxylating)
MVVATGRSDYPNQLNNALVFPGLFRGLLDARAQKVTNKIKLAAAHALAGLVKTPSAKNIIPSIFDKRVAPTVANAVKKLCRQEKK